MDKEFLLVIVPNIAVPRADNRVGLHQWQWVVVALDLNKYKACSKARERRALRSILSSNHMTNAFQEAVLTDYSNWTDERKGSASSHDIQRLIELTKKQYFGTSGAPVPVASEGSKC